MDTIVTNDKSVSLNFLCFCFCKESVQRFTINSNPEEEPMKEKSIITIQKGRGTQLNCTRGDLWITEKGSEDIHLKSNEHYNIQGNGKTVIEVLRESSFEIL